MDEAAGVPVSVETGDSVQVGARVELGLGVCDGGGDGVDEGEGEGSGVVMMIATAVGTAGLDQGMMGLR